MCLIAAWVEAFDSSFAAMPNDCSNEMKENDEQKNGEYTNGVKVVTGISARPGNLKVCIARAAEGM